MLVSVVPINLLTSQEWPLSERLIGLVVVLLSGLSPRYMYFTAHFLILDCPSRIVFDCGCKGIGIIAPSIQCLEPCRSIMDIEQNTWY